MLIPRHNLDGGGNLSVCVDFFVFAFFSLPGTCMKNLVNVLD